MLPRRLKAWCLTAVNFRTGIDRDIEWNGLARPVACVRGNRSNMGRYQSEYAWEKIKRFDLVLAVEAMLESEVKTFSRPLENGELGVVNIQFTKDPEYLDDAGEHFGRLESLRILFKDVAPEERFNFKSSVDATEAQYNINVKYRLPLFSAKFVQESERTFLKRMALFDLGFLLGQALDSGYYQGLLREKFPDPRHKWDRAIRSRVPFLDNAARIYVPPRPKHEPLQNRKYFDR